MPIQTAEHYQAAGKRRTRGEPLRQLDVQAQSRQLRRGRHKRRTLLKEVWVLTQTAEHYQANGKRITHGKPEMAGCAGPKPTATVWSAQEEGVPHRSLSADADGWLVVRAQCWRLRRVRHKNRVLLTEVWVMTQTAVCAGPEPTATAWSAKEKELS